MRAILFLALLLQLSISYADEVVPGNIYDGQTGTSISLDHIVASLPPGTAIIVSENHGHQEHHQNQRDFLVKLAKKNVALSVGMEFFEYPKQNIVHQFVHENLSETQFLEQMGWSTQNSFSDYRFQVKLPHFTGGTTLALNAPRSLTKQVAQKGLDSLTDKHKSLLPPNFTLGSELYLHRFRKAMGGHASEEQLQNYFAAQSIWDETMAWKTTDYLSLNPDHYLAIIVGDFHGAYNLGLPARLTARGLNQWVVISQVAQGDRTQKELEEAVLPHPLYGPRADYVWVTH